MALAHKTPDEKTPLLPVTVQSPSRPPLVSNPTRATAGVSREKQWLSGEAAPAPMVEQTSASLHTQPCRQDVLRVDKEAVIQTSKPQLMNRLAKKLDQRSQTDFLTLGQRILSTVRARHHHLFEEMLHVYRLFDPQNAGRHLTKGNLQQETVEHIELLFLRLLLHMLTKSNYRMLTDAEARLALQDTYLLNVPIRVDSSKLDSSLLSRFLQKQNLRNPPKFANQYLIFRRGVGIDLTTGFFILAKMDLVLDVIWRRVLVALRLRRPCPPQQQQQQQEEGGSRSQTVVHDIRTKKDEPGSSLSIERIRLENMRLSFGMLFSRNTIQEPTFERIILIYRGSTPRGSSLALGERSICVKQFRHIPMADMEIVLPEKETPGLRPSDWAFFLATVLGGLFAILASLTLQFSMTVAISLLAALVSYIIKVYYAWTQNMQMYQALLQQSMYDKQLDSGRGTLLHLCDDVEQQEFKEALVAYFVLLTQGTATRQELGRRCEQLMEEEFGESLQFDVGDALEKLQRLGISRAEGSERYAAYPLKHANALIGLTTDEMFGTTDLTKFVEPGYLERNVNDVVNEEEELAQQLYRRLTNSEAPCIDADQENGE